MADPQLLDYIRSQLHEGRNQETIKNTLLTAGWSEENINQAFSSLTQPQPPPPSSAEEGASSPLRLIPRGTPVSSTSPQPFPSPEPVMSQLSPLPKEGEGKPVPGIASEPIVLENKFARLVKFVFTFLTLILLTAALGGILYYFVNQQRTELKELVAKQEDNLGKITENYAEIVQATHDLRGVSQGPNGEIKLPPKDVLGLEDNLSIVALRKLEKLYGEGGKRAEEIDDLNRDIEAKASVAPLKLFMTPSADLFEKTGRFADGQIKLFTYLEKASRLELKAYNAIVEVDSALTSIGIIGLNESTLKLLDEKIKNIEEVKKQFSELDASSLPKEVPEQHLKSLDALTKVHASFQKISEAIKQNNPQSFIQGFQSLIAEALVEGVGVSRAEIIVFWEDKEIEAAGDLKKDWGKFKQELKNLRIGPVKF